MKPALAQFESANKYNLIRINMDKKSSPEYKKNIGHFQGRGIPYFAVLDKNGKKVGGWAGGVSAAELNKRVSKYVR